MYHTDASYDIGSAVLAEPTQNAYVDTLLSAYFARIEAEPKATGTADSWLTEVINPILADEYHTKKVLRMGWFMVGIIVLVGVLS